MWRVQVYKTQLKDLLSGVSPVHGLAIGPEHLQTCG